MRIDPPFPADRRSDPMRRAELRIYLQLAQSGVAGRALYGVQAGERCRELDFLVYLDAGHGRIGIEVKGGSTTASRTENGGCGPPMAGSANPVRWSSCRRRLAPVRRCLATVRGVGFSYCRSSPFPT